MNSEEIQKFIQSNKLSDDKYLKITFKKRNPIYGIIVHTSDSSDLESKNFWRIVPSSNINEWRSSKNLNFSRLFNGHEFTALRVE